MRALLIIIILALATPTWCDSDPCDIVRIYTEDDLPKVKYVEIGEIDYEHKPVGPLTVYVEYDIIVFIGHKLKCEARKMGANAIIITGSSKRIVVSEQKPEDRDDRQAPTKYSLAYALKITAMAIKTEAIKPHGAIKTIPTDNPREN